MSTLQERLNKLKTVSPAFKNVKLPDLPQGPVDRPKYRKKPSSNGKSSTQKGGFAAPKAVTDVISKGPFFGGIELTTDLWQMALGTRQDKVDTALDYLPVNQPTKDYVTQTINRSKTTPENSAFWGEYVLGPTNTPTNEVLPDLPKLPSLGDLGNKALLGVALIAAVYLIGKAIK